MSPVVIKKLDEVFSEFIRLRDADSNGIVHCISCKNPFHWKSVDAGHFIPRSNMATRFNEINVNGQCKDCNQFKSGNTVAYLRGLREKYGQRGVDELMAYKNQTAKISDSEGQGMIKEYKGKIKILKEEKYQGC